MRYEFVFGGEITVIADSEQEAYEMVDEFVAPTAYAADHCESITVNNIELVNTEDEAESER